MDWNPGHYLAFADHRLRPGLELLARVPLEGPGAIIDLGCGTGELTRRLAERWPDARVIGLDRSPAMLERARAGDADGSVEWIEGSVEDWSPGEPGDLLFSNATLHWVSEHETLFPRLLGAIAPGGCLAVQMPLSWSAPSHRLMRSVLAGDDPGVTAPIGPAALRERLGRDPVMDPRRYHDLLEPWTSRLDVWTTEYLQVLEPGDDGEHPVLAWVRGTGLRPVLETLDEADRTTFLEAYASSLHDAYPLDERGRAVYPFRRLFIVAGR